MPRRCLATWTAASIPPARWNTSTTSARQTSAGGREDLVSLEPLGDPVTVPALKRLLHAVADPLGQAELGREGIGGGPVVVQHLLGSLTALAEERDAEPGPLDRRPAGAEVAEHEQRLGRGAREVGVPEIGLQRGVVAEPLRLFVGVDVAADPGDQRRVVDDLRSAASRPSPSASRSAIRHSRSTCSIGWPMPRSVASDSTASNSARVTRVRAGSAMAMNIGSRSLLP